MVNSINKQELDFQKFKKLANQMLKGKKRSNIRKLKNLLHDFYKNLIVKHEVKVIVASDKEIKFMENCGNGIIDSNFSGNINYQDPSDFGSSPLITAVLAGQIEVVKFLIDKGADLNIKDAGGFTALMYSVIYNQYEIFKVLIDNGADINTTNRVSVSAIYYSMRGDNTRVKFCELLIEKSANLDIITSVAKLIDRCSKKEILAISTNSIIEFIVRQHLNLNKDINFYLRMACDKKDTDAVSFFMDAKHKIDFFSINSHGESAYSILLNHEFLPEKLQSLKEKLMLERLIE